MKRPIRIANCSGAIIDPGYQMYRQATLGPVDAVVGDYLAEMNIANNAVAMSQGAHPGYEPTCLSGLEMTLPVIAEKKIKIVVNGGALNPKGLAIKVASLAKEKNIHNITIAWVEGDNLLPMFDSPLGKKKLDHLDGDNDQVRADPSLQQFMNAKPVSANAYLGARGIYTALMQGADIVICGRVADASPVIGLAQWWHGWATTNYDALAGTLLAGHLIECSGYITGSNFSNFTAYPISTFVDIGYPIAEIDHKGECVITKHENTKGLVNLDTVRSQLLYELQGNIYLNSDVKADLGGVRVEQVGEDRVRVTGAKGHPPPSTTKLAVFYHGGYQAEIWIGLTGSQYEVERKAELMRQQVEYAVKKAGVRDKVDVLEFQLYGSVAPDASSKTGGTAMLRLFTQTATADNCKLVTHCMTEFALGMQHISGLHTSDPRTLQPKPFLVYYPALIAQKEIQERVHILGKDGKDTIVTPEPVKTFERLAKRESYDYDAPSSAAFGATTLALLGSVVQARSGDKGGNLNIGFFVQQPDEYTWLNTLLSRSKIREMLAADWDESYHVERVEFPGLLAVHFVIYGILGRGCSSSVILDSLGKGFADYIRNKIVDIPNRFLSRRGTKANFPISPQRGMNALLKIQSKL